LYSPTTGRRKSRAKVSRG